MRSLDVSNKSQKRCLFRDFYATSQKHLTQEFVAFQNYPTKIFWRDFRRVIEISYKIDGWPLETLKKWNFFWLQCTAINRVCHELRITVDGYLLQFWQVNDCQSPAVVVLFTSFSYIFWLLVLYYVTCFQFLKYRILGEV